jgi:predicted O-methyltransferase YrrM
MAVMATERWAAVDEYFGQLMIGDDPVLVAAEQAAEAAGLPAIAVSPAQGKLLHLLARAIGARRILEIGTLAGYSTIWLARALPAEGRLITCEYEPRHAEVARANLAAAGLAERVDIRVGPALETLPSLVSGAPFDLVFIDADKEHNADYFEWALRLSRQGAVVITDNVVRGGAVLDAEHPDSRVRGSRRFAERAGSETGASSTTLQTVGVKGWDGFTFTVVEAPAS